jgi:protein-disulfide isomerase
MAGKRINFSTGLVLVLVLALAWSGHMLAADGPDGADARIQQAIDAYKAELKAEADAAADARVANLAMDALMDPGTPVIGNPDGDVVIVEFFDYQCSFCKAAEPRLRKLVETDGNIRHVIKDFPILSPVSIIAAKAALASVAQGKHAPFHQGMMDHRGQLTEDRVWTIAENVGLDVARLKEDIRAPAVADQLIANMNLARKLRMVVVPGFIVNTHVLSGLTAETETAKIDFGKEVAAARAAEQM